MQIEIQNLLKDVAFNIRTLKEAKKRFADQLAPEFSIFDYFCSDEMALSKCLASLLDPQGTHGQGSIFIQSFFEKLCPNVTWIKEFEHCNVVTEKQANGQRRIDIHLTFNEGLIGIENKPWAADQHLQLLDYANHLQESSSGKNWLLLYLSNRPPSEDSLPPTKREQLEGDKNFIQCNYHELIEWLDACKAKSKALNVRIFLEELIKFIRININGELEMSEEIETSKTALASKQNLCAFFNILKATHGVRQNLLKNFRDHLENKLNTHGFYIAWDDSMNNTWKSCSGFGVKFLKDQDIYLRFEFEKEGLNNFLWGIRRENSSTKNDSTRWEGIAEHMTQTYGKGGTSPWWPWYSISSNELFGREIQHWGDTEFLWKEMIEKQGIDLADKITSQALQIRKIFSNNLCLLAKSIS